MNNSNQLVIFEGAYNNDDVYDKVIGYIYKKRQPICGYAIPIQVSFDTMVQHYTNCEIHSNSFTDRKLWHFTFSLCNDQKDDFTKLMLLCDKIAQYFSMQFPILYSPDYSSNHLHVHFVVNSYSYHSHVWPLDSQTFYALIENIVSAINQLDPSHPTQIIIKKEADKYVRNFR